MRKLDTWVDTYEKRFQLLSLLIFGVTLLFSILHLILAIRLFQLHNFEDVFAVMDEWIVKNTFFGRTALVFLNLPVLSFWDIIFQLFRLQTYEMIFLLGNILLLFSRFRKTSWINLGLFLSSVILFVGLTGLAFSSGTLSNVIQILHWIAYLFIVCYGSCLIINGIAFVFSLNKYVHELQTEVIYVE